MDEAAATEQGFDIYGLTKNVHFIYDIRTFTLYAFMNYTGYDDNNGHPITGTRAALREDLAAMDIKISSPNYYTSKKWGDSNSYHLTLDSGKLGIDGCVDMILKFREIMDAQKN